MFNLIKVTNKRNNIFLENEKNKQYNIGGVEIGNKIYIFNYFYRMKHTNYAKNKKVIYFEDYISDVIKSKLKEQLRLYVIQNINNYDIYKRNSIIDIVTNLNQDIISRAYISLRSINLDKIRENKISIYGYEKNFIYDLEKDILDIIKEGKKINILNSFLSQEMLDYAVAQEQYKRGIAPNIVNELQKINEFVQGKCTIKVILNDDSIHTVKKYSQVFYNISSIFSCYENSNLEIWKRNISGNYNENINLKDIKALKYGQIILPINHENLKYEVEYKIKKKVA